MMSNALFDTASPFDTLPYEILERIFKRIAHCKKDVYQFQLLNKRCQSIAEKKCFEALPLYSQFNAQWILEFAKFLAKPHRSKLVRTLQLLENPFMELNDQFFEMFCNISTVSLGLGIKIDWQHFNETFTPTRCKLKELPFPFPHRQPYNDDEVEQYFKTVEAHSQTLENLDCTEIASCLEDVSWNLPRVRSIIFRWLDEPLKNIDIAINKCPQLQELLIRSKFEEPFIPYICSTQHQQMMKKITVDIGSTLLFDLCTYLAAKFPNVQEWSVSNHSIFDSFYSTDDPFEETANALHQIMKSAKVHLNICTSYLSIAKVYDFLQLYKLYTYISISYEYEDYSALSETDEEEDDTDEQELLYLHLRYHPSSSTFNRAHLTYTGGGLKHLELIKKFGHYPQKFELSLLDYGSGEQENADEKRMLQGGALAHLLDSCPLLTSVEYEANILKSIGCSSSSSKGLKQLALRCEKIDPDVLVDISHKVPGVVDLTIYSHFTEWTHSDDKKQVLINMPKNSFDRLVFKNYHEKEEEDRGVVMVKITSLALSETKYYIQEHNGEEITVFANASNEQEYETPSLFHHCIRIAVTCQSVKYMEYRTQLKKREVHGCAFKAFI